MSIPVLYGRHFSSRDAVDIRGLGPRALQQLHASGLVTRPRDLYSLAARHSDAKGEIAAEGGGGGGIGVSLLDLPGWGAVSVSNLFAAIDQSRDTITLKR
jgi:DNA ligase (NAD+)